MDAQSEQAVINNSSKIVQETNEDEGDKSLHSVKSDCNTKEKEAQVRVAAMAMNSLNDYTMPLNAVPANNYGLPTDHPTSSVMEEKSEQNVINNSSKIVQETRGSEDISLHSAKSDCSKTEKEGKIHPDKNDNEKHNISHDKVSSISTIKPHALYQQQYPSAQYLPAIHKLNPRLASPHEGSRGADQARIPIPGEVDERKKPKSILSSHYKSDNTDMKQSQSPAVHQQTQLNTPFHSRGVLPPSAHIDVRTSNPAHSPSSHIYKKDSIHNQQIPPLHNPANVKRPRTEHPNKEHSRTHLNLQGSHKASSISPGPVGMPAVSSPLPWHIVPNSHLSTPQSRIFLPNNEQSNCTISVQIPLMLSSDVRVHAPPPPAHTKSQPSKVPAVTLTHSNQVPCFNADILRRYPVIWQGVLALKTAQVPVQMHFVSGNPNIARASLPSNANGEAKPVRIAQRMRLEPAQLDGVYRKIQLMDEHCILMAWPYGKSHTDLIKQADNLKFEFISYLLNKEAAGIVNAAAPGTQQTAFIIHIFPACDFMRNNLSRIAPSLLDHVDETSHLWIVIGTA